MLRIVSKADLIGAPCDGRRLVEGRVGDGQTVAGGHIAVGVIGESGVDDATRDR